MKPLAKILCLAVLAGCGEGIKITSKPVAKEPKAVELSDLPVMSDPETPIAVWNGVEWLPLNVDAPDGSRLDIRLLTLSDQGASVETLEQWSKTVGKWNSSKRKEPPHHEQ